METILSIVGFIVGIIVVLIVLLVGYIIAISMWKRRRELQRAKEMTIDTTDPLLTDLDVTRPAIVYFTADWCGPCKLQQKPTLEKLQVQQPDLQIITVDASKPNEIADRWGVQSLPRTFVIGANRNVYATNMGLADLHLLSEQIASAMQGKSGDSMRVTLPESDNKSWLPKIKRI